MTDAQFTQTRGRALDRVEMTEALFRDVEPSGGRFDRVRFNGAMMRGVELVDVQIGGEIDQLTMNGVAVAPLINAGLDRRCPDRGPLSASAAVSGQGF